MKRSCGGCTLCCKLLPVRELDKGADQRCKHQRFGKGCDVYQQPGMPLSCRLWSCRWLKDEAAINLSRPDRSHCVIDIMPDYVTAAEGTRKIDIEVVQLWVDANYPDAHRDPALRAYLEQLCEKRNAMVLVRYSDVDSFCLIPPFMNSEHRWVEHQGQLTGKTHTAEEVLSAVGRIF